MGYLLFFTLLMMSHQSLFSQTTLISATRMNLLYEWVDNPIQIAVENYACEDLVAKVDKGTLIGSGCKYIYKTDDFGYKEVKITIGIRQRKKTKWIDSVNFRVRKLSDPNVSFAGYNSYFDSIYRGRILFTPIISGPNPYPHDIYINTDVISFSLRVMRNDSIIFKEVHDSIVYTYDTSYFLYYTVKNDSIIAKGINDTLLNAPDTLREIRSSNLTSEANWFFKNDSKTGDRIIIEDIVVLIWGKEKRQVANLEFILKDYP